MEKNGNCRDALKHLLKKLKKSTELFLSMGLNATK